MYIIKPNDTFSRSAKKKRDHIDPAIGSHMKVAFVAISAAPCLKQVGRTLRGSWKMAFVPLLSGMWVWRSTRRLASKIALKKH